MKFLHISDIHFNPSKDGFATRDLRKKFEEYVQEKGIVDINEVFFTGDFRDAYEHDGKTIDEVAADAVKCLRDIASCVGVKGVDADSHIHIVPGNHDLDRYEYIDDKIEKKKRKKESKKILKKIYNNYDLHAGQFLKDVYGVPALDYLRSRFGFFEKCVSLLNNEVWSDFSKESIHRFKDYGEYCIIYMNTAIASGRKQDRGNLVIGLDDFAKAIEKAEGKPLFILAHNPPEHLFSDEWKKITNILNDNQIPVLWFAGDKHDTDYDNSYNIARITVGSMTQKMGTKASFYVGEFNDSRLTSIMAHGYSVNDGWWQPEEALTKRVCASIPEQINGIVNSTFIKKNIKKTIYGKVWFNYNMFSCNMCLIFSNICRLEF